MTIWLPRQGRSCAGLIVAYAVAMPGSYLERFSHGKTPWKQSSFAIAQRHEMNGDETRAFEYHKLALACAVQAAPYCHSRMQPKADPHDDDKKVEITIRRLVSDPSCRKCSDTVNADVPANGWMTRPHQME